MKVLMAAAAVLIAATLTPAANAGKPLPEQIARTITKTWTCQDTIGQTRTKAGNIWAKHSPGYRRYQLRVWQARLAKCEQERTTIRRLQQGLAGTPMAGSETALNAAARRYGISPFFIAAIAGTESSFGAVPCSNNRHNAFGLSSCGSGWHVPYFPTWKDAYLFMGEFLSSRWPSATTTMHYYGYAACSSCWGAKTAQHMRQRFGVGPNVRYAGAAAP